MGLLVVVVQQKWRDPLALASHYSRRVCYIYTYLHFSVFDQTFY